MRNYLLLFCLFCWTAGFSQQSGSSATPLVIKQLPAQGHVLTTWKFHNGDNPAFATTQYYDSQWTSINPALEVKQLPQLKYGVMWLRLHLLLDSTLLKQLALTVHQAGASEIYLNGKLIQRFGTLSHDPSQAVAVDPKGKVISLSGVVSGENVLAMRYALQPGVSYTNMRGRQNPAFQATLLPLANAIELYQRGKTRAQASDSFQIGVFLLFFLLHFAMYLYHPAKKANFFFSLFALFNLLCMVIEFNLPHEMKSLFYHKYAAGICNILAVVLLFVGCYTVLNQRRGWVFWGIMAVIPLAFLLVELGWGGPLAMVLMNLVYIEIIRLIVKAIRSKHKGAWLFAAGAASYIVFWTLFLLGFQYGYNFKPLGETFLYHDLLFNLAVLGNPIFISIYLGVDFARTSKTLSQKLGEVEALSVRTLEQERERQQILSTQNEVLEQQVAERTSQLQHSLQQLKATQAQLVQQEKMASLGELTAGIAHEIQNPLNFVNNFSETNVELIDELQQEADKGNLDEVKQLANYIKENEQKIVYHGRRADSIVKSMMGHSRTSKGEKRPTNLNVLTEEYLQLAYHSFRVKDSNLSVVLETHYDPAVEGICVVPQDIGRVLLNLFGNAFYAVSEKKRQLNGTYEPVVSVGTKQCSDRVEIHVKDNGTGISQNAVDKIFQPFFTTKPTGEGTGLGLSLSYDIITKGHGGMLRVESREGEGAEFVIQLPL